jgi:GT2 family glycosyltransferase
MIEGHEAKDHERPEGSQTPAELLVVVVLSHNKREQTLRCLESVYRMRYAPREVLCVDSGSADGSADAVAAAFPGVHLLRSPTNLGAAGGRNHGLRWAADRFPYCYLLFLDDDTVADEHLADELVDALRRDPSAGLATPKAYRAATPGVIASAGGMRVRLGRASITDIGAGEEDRGQFEQSTTVESCAGFTVLARRTAIERCGGFDDAYNPYGWEEVEWSLRIREAGFTIRYAPAAVCWHAGGAPGRGKRILEYERGKAANFMRLMRRHATPAQWLVFLAVAPMRGTRLIGMRLRDRNWRILLEHARGLAAGLWRRGQPRPESSDGG